MAEFCKILAVLVPTPLLQGLYYGIKETSSVNDSLFVE